MPALYAARSATPRACPTVIAVVTLVLKNSSSTATVSGRYPFMSSVTPSKRRPRRRGISQPGGVVTVPCCTYRSLLPSCRMTPQPIVAVPGSIPRIVVPARRFATSTTTESKLNPSPKGLHHSPYIVLRDTREYYRRPCNNRGLAESGRSIHPQFTAGCFY